MYIRLRLQINGDVLHYTSDNEQEIEREFDVPNYASGGVIKNILLQQLPAMVDALVQAYRDRELELMGADE